MALLLLHASQVKKQSRLRSEDIVEVRIAFMGLFFCCISLLVISPNTCSNLFLQRASLSSPTKFQVLYVDGSQIIAMHQSTYEQIEIPLSLLGTRAHFVRDGITIVIESHADVPVLVHLPPRMTFEVSEIDDASSTAMTTQGFKLRVPKHVRPGDTIVVDTDDGRYISKE